MEKVGKILKTIVISMLVVLIISGVFYFVSGIDGVKNWFDNLFNHHFQLDVNAFDGADSNSNAGLSEKQIHEQESNDACPKHTDMSDIIYIQDYNDFVCFYRALQDDVGNMFYPNIVFVKTNVGLKFDGALNMWGNYEFSTHKYTFNQDMTKIPSYWSNGNQNAFGGSKTDLCIFDSSDISFCSWYTNSANWWWSLGLSTCVEKIQFYSDENITTMLDGAQQYVSQNIFNKYFLKYCNDNVEIIQDQESKEKANGQFNFFYDYLYRSSLTFDYKDKDDKSVNYGTCSVDMTSLTCSVIPVGQRTTKIPNSNPVEYFSVYSCNRFMTCNYQKIEQSSIYAGNTSVSDGLKDDPVETKDIPATADASVLVNLVPADSKYLNSTICDVVAKSPVIINYYSQVDSKEILARSVKFNSSAFLNAKGVVITQLPLGNYRYEIVTDQLLFKAYSGNVAVTKSGSFDYEYTYQNGQVVASFNIKPATADVDYSKVDLANYPVKLIYTNVDTNKVYQYIFDSIDKVGVVQSQLMPIGKYTYVILSEKLIFGSAGGNIEIKPQNRNFVYNFAVEYNKSDLAFTIDVKTSSSSTDGSFNLSGSSSTVQLLGSKLGLQNYYVNVTIFDEKGNIIETFNHSHNGSGSCGANWSTNSLTAGIKYSAQMTYANGTDNKASTFIAYQSATFSFDYTLKTLYTLTYSCVEVA